MTDEQIDILIDRIAELKDWTAAAMKLAELDKPAKWIANRLEDVELEARALREELIAGHVEARA